MAPFVIPLGIAAAAACSRDIPTEPVLAAEASAAEATARRAGAIQIREMLDDPLFQAVVASLSKSAVGEPLSASLAALDAGHREAAAPFVAKANAIAQTLSNRTGPDADILMLWSVLERYLEAAGLL